MLVIIQFYSKMHGPYNNKKIWCNNLLGDSCDFSQASCSEDVLDPCVAPCQNGNDGNDAVVSGAEKKMWH
jgi:hypothetical protein